ncbi:MAG: NADH-quinone oxidoreductase subunit L [Pseudomonadota bacterium]
MIQAIVFLPLFAAILAGFFGRQLGNRGAQMVTTLAVTTGAVLSWIVFFDVALGHNAYKVTLAEWMSSGTLDVYWALRVDTLTAVMLVVVNSVSALVHWYSIGYMSHDPHRPRFMAYLSLFTFAMLMLVTADNLVQMFFGWEGVGLASYLLIGFWFKKPSANAAAVKAFVVNRVGDFGYSLGIFAIFLVFGTVGFDEVFAKAPEIASQTFNFLWFEADVMTTICLLLFVGAMGKSAQLGLHTWLPDAMEGPTPVSALIHAATMVTAGVFMVARCSPLFEQSQTALTVVTVVGASTAFFAATIGLVQNDIKRVIAYSTCSQLGYMFFALGVSAYSAGIFHLFTHAFFKALLFLGAGSVIHAMHDEQDMRNMGGLWKKIPWTFAVMLIGTLAITGVPVLSGYYSKDMIIEAAYASHAPAARYAFTMGVIAAFFTAFYSWRLIFLTFFGKTRSDQKTFDAAHESPPVMLIPLLALAVGAVFAGMTFYPYFVGDYRAEFWNGTLTMLGDIDIIEEAHHVPTLIKKLPVIMGGVGLALAALFYLMIPSLPKTLAGAFKPVYLFLLNKWYWDELYDAIIVKPSLWLGRLFWKGGDGRIIDGLGPDGIAATVLNTARKSRTLQTGYLFHYAFAMLIAVVSIGTFFALGAVTG